MKSATKHRLGDALHSYEGHDIVNLCARWQAVNRWLLSMRLTNLAGSEYAERADYTGFSGDRYFPGECRLLYFGVKKRW